MSDVAVHAERLGKRYRLGGPSQRPSYWTLRETIMGILSGSRAPATGGSDDRALWALKDVSFDVKHGEVVGIIGRNGAGKSTLLKVLSRITEPTTGFADVYGRVGSLLEVGTGFHPELTGRENVFLNGQILGMSKADIRRRFDEIVAFAELERFLDTPVKRYSSGMYMRLAFSVAAHLEPEVLVVDEVLAVGDASFQHKCLDKMQDVGQSGRTVLFVSHNMPAVTRLCSRAVLLFDGEVQKDGPAGEVVNAYLNAGVGSMAVREWPDPARAPGNDVVRLRAVRVRSESGSASETVDIRQPVQIEMEYDVLTPGYVLVPNMHLYNEERICVFITNDPEREWRRRPRPVGRYVSTARVPGNFLAEGTLMVDAAVSTMDPVIVHVWERSTIGFQVVDSIDGDSVRGDYAGPYPGVVRPMLEWSTEEISPNVDAPLASHQRSAT